MRMRLRVPVVCAAFVQRCAGTRGADAGTADAQNCASCESAKGGQRPLLRPYGRVACALCAGYGARRASALALFSAPNELTGALPSLAADAFSPSLSLYLCRYTLSGSTYSSKPSVDIAHSRSSPLMVLRFSRWHLSLALWSKPGERQGAHEQGASRRDEGGGGGITRQARRVGSWVGWMGGDGVRGGGQLTQSGRGKQRRCET